MKWNRNFGHYYSEDRRYMIERSPYGGWNLYTKSRPELQMFDVHVINCDLLREAKEAADSHAVEIATREALARAGMLAQETEEINNEEENKMKYVMYPKIYTYTEGRHYEETRSATQAMQWHREGKRITVWGVNPDDESQYHVSIRGAAQKPARTAEDENRATCRRIAQEIDAYADGGVYSCPDCGEILLLPDDVGDRYRCPHCHEVNDVDDLEQLSLWDYLADALDVEYTCGSDREYRSVRVMVACGGPNIYLNSATKDVELYWWNERARYPMHYDTAEALDQWAEEYWNM